MVPTTLRQGYETALQSSLAPSMLVVLVVISIVGSNKAPWSTRDYNSLAPALVPNPKLSEAQQRGSSSLTSSHNCQNYQPNLEIDSTVHLSFYPL